MKAAAILLYKQIEKPFSKPVSLKIPNKALLFQCSPDSAPRRRNPCNGKGCRGKSVVAGKPN
jgi:hypothetical protein